MTTASGFWPEPVGASCSGVHSNETSTALGKTVAYFEFKRNPPGCFLPINSLNTGAKGSLQIHAEADYAERRP